MYESGRRFLFWTALVCAMVLPIVTQAQVTAALFATPVNECQLSAPNCQMPGCTCPCCKNKGSQKSISGCNCSSVSLVYLPSIGASGPLHWSAPSYFAFITAIPRIIPTDIFRPPIG